MSVLYRTFETLTQFEQKSLRWVSARVRHPWVDPVMQAFTRAGDWQTWTALGVIGIASGGIFRALALSVGPKVLATFGLCYVIKGLSRRKRPNVAMGDFSSLLSNPDPYSFPSSHSACAWAACMGVGFSLGWGWPLWIGYALAISYSRIHVGAHYPLDVLIGSAIGIGIAAF